MICMPELRGMAWRGLVAAIAGAMAASAWSTPGVAEPSAQAAQFILSARQDLSRGDGIGAEIKLKRALASGAPREAVAAYMGEAFIQQDNPDKARVWLESGLFAPNSAATGFRALGRLEQQEGNLPAAGRAFDRAIKLTPRDATMWVEVARLRYAGAEHVLAIEAADYALQLDPKNVRALEFRGQIVRDQLGLVAALPWFETALKYAPNDLSVLGEYAATLGELDRAREMLAVTRKMLDLDPRSPRAFYLQAVMAARAGNTELARKLFDRTDDAFADLPGAMLLEGVLQIRAGNYFMAIEALEKLAKRQPANVRVHDLLARAYFLADEHGELVRRFAADALREDASPYLQTLVARSYEALGQRDMAGPLLDRAALRREGEVIPVYQGSPIGILIAEGRMAEAEAATEADRTAFPGSAHNEALAGDVQLALGHNREALERYRKAAYVRLSESLLARMVAAHLRANDMQEARALADSFLYWNPTSKPATRLSARLAAEAGDWHRARLLLEYLKANGSSRDVALMSKLALVQLRDGDGRQAALTAREAYGLQRSSPLAAQALGLCLATLGQSPANARALLDKARQIMGDTPLLAEGRRLLTLNRQG